MSAKTLGKDLKRIEESLKVLETEKRAIEINRRVYRRADGKRVKPLDKLLGVAPYERRNHAVRETESGWKTN